MGKALHADEQAATIAFTTRPAFHVTGNLLPASKVEIADAKVRPIGKVDRLAQCGQKLLFDVIENARHSYCYIGRWLGRAGPSLA